MGTVSAKPLFRLITGGVLQFALLWCFNRWKVSLNSALMRNCVISRIRLDTGPPARSNVSAPFASVADQTAPRGDHLKRAVSLKRLMLFSMRRNFTINWQFRNACVTWAPEIDVYKRFQWPGCLSNYCCNSTFRTSLISFSSSARSIAFSTRSNK